ncbi:cytokine-dependent hematopoietic cell linker isoform X2 [Thalassophryne amazonica]|uniref:cytokine-dependent hematopoietic cell linker isoform X2 n=1 Tax=Thalassophryne amazonica TaxID=390379 RepID=UPI0014721B5D|nr:cytokine-dependent hematopoietic cell linker isoform X2 [Thalassophryne amazonica]
MEHEYDITDDQEDAFKVHIYPARSMEEDGQYADRDLPRSRSSPGLSTKPTTNVLPRCSRTQMSLTSGPPINRDLKPGRRKTKLDESMLPSQMRQQLSQRCSPSPPPSTTNLANQLSGLSLQKPSRRNGQKTTEKAACSSSTTGLQSGECISARHSSTRYLDLETQHVEKWLQPNLEEVLSKHQHQEWARTEDDIGQPQFVPLEMSQETCFEKDWYVGVCSRADAEHALHLVNKEGAFLVRDCSNNTNSEPLVLVVYHDKKVYNVKIRFIESTRKFALGTGQRSNDMFDSVAEIITFHSTHPVTLISGRNVSASKYPENCVLTYAVTKTDVDQLLQ